jgi:hypothetical protein
MIVCVNWYHQPIYVQKCHKSCAAERIATVSDKQKQSEEVQMQPRLFLGVAVYALSSVLVVSISPADIGFTDITAQAGIENTAKGACVAFADYNGDGFMDIYVGNSGKFPEPLGKPNLLYRNNGDGTFTDIAAEAGVADERQTQGAAFGDLDNDGDPDLYVANDFAINALYFSKGDGSFEDVTEAAGVRGGVDVIGGDEIPNGYGTVLADQNNDGYLDIYVVNLGGANILYCNNCDGTFKDATEQAGVKAGIGPQGAGTAAVFSDCNNDGKLDLYAVNGYGLPSFFYCNNGGEFDDVTDKAGVGELADAQGAAFGDYDNDGDMDLYVTNCASLEGAPLPNILYMNDGKGIFEDVTEKAGVGGEGYSLGAVFGDLDNDGYLDLYVVNNGGPNVLYRNNGDGTFTDVTSQAGVGNEALGSNAVLGDIDNDGYLDIYLANTGFSDSDEGDPDVLYRNNGGTNHWLQVQLRGTTSNYTGIGARVKVSAGDLHQIREISGGRGYAQDSSIANFGLGIYTLADIVEVTWPSGIIQTLANVTADQLIIVEEGSSALVQPYTSSISTWGEVKQTKSHTRYPTSETGIRELSSTIGQNYPNPFNPETWIPYQLAQSGLAAITIYDSAGQLVRVLDLGYRKAGMYLSHDKAAYWDGRNTAGEDVSSGVYFYHIQAADFADIRKMLLIR